MREGAADPQIRQGCSRRHEGDQPLSSIANLRARSLTSTSTERRQTIRYTNPSAALPRPSHGGTPVCFDSSSSVATVIAKLRQALIWRKST
jgi:hypothetical protein